MKTPEENRAQWRAQYHKHRLDRVRRAKEDHAKKSAAVKTLLGGVCVKCGFSDQRILQIDHIVPIRRDVKKQRGQLTGGYSVVRMLKLGEWKLDDLQLLCPNCHALKTLSEIRAGLAGSGAPKK